MTDTPPTSEADWRERLAGPDDHLVEVDGDTILPTRLCGGPWSPDAQHGSAAAATLAWATEQAELPVPMRPVRFTVDLLSPVPMTPLRWETNVVKAGKRIAVVDAALFDGDRIATRATTLLMRKDVEFAIPPGANQPPEPAMPATEAIEQDDFEPADGWTPPGFAFAMDYERLAGAIGRGAPASVRMRLRTKVVKGEDPTPFQWLVAAADMGSQLGGFLPYAEFRTINADFTIHISRLPREPWIAMDGIHRVAPDAIGQTTATMFDETGFLATMQSSVHIDRWGE